MNLYQKYEEMAKRASGHGMKLKLEQVGGGWAWEWMMPFEGTFSAYGSTDTPRKEMALCFALENCPFVFRT